MAESPAAPRVRPSRASLAQRAPWLPADWEPADAAALQAVAEGRATPDQQKRALDWIIMKAAGTYEPSYRPGGSEGDRDTAFAEGRRFVGGQIVKLVTVSLYKLRTKHARSDDGNPTGSA